MIKRTTIIFFLLGLLSISTDIFPRHSIVEADIYFEGESNFTLDDDWDIDDETPLVYDPYKKYNRFMFNTNDKLYRYLFDPIAKGYDFLVPKKVQGSFNNFINFASTPKRFFNNLFQKKPKSAAIEFSRLLVNASVGIGGLFDPADSLLGLEQQTEDFGQTLGYYGNGPGPYIILPVLGPSTGRDFIGMGMDRAFSPFMWLSNFDVDPERAFTIIKGVKRVNKYTYSVRDNYGRMKESAIDPYIALQNAYIQNRNKEIAE